MADSRKRKSSSDRSYVTLSRKRRRSLAERAYLVNRIRGGRYLRKGSKADHFIVEWSKKDGSPYPEESNQKWYWRSDFVSKEADEILDEETTLGVTLEDKWNLLADSKIPNDHALKFDQTVREKVRPHFVHTQLEGWDDFEVYIFEEVALVTRITYEARVVHERTDFHYVCFESPYAVHPVPLGEHYEEKSERQLWEALVEWARIHKQNVPNNVAQVEFEVVSNNVARVEVVANDSSPSSSGVSSAVSPSSSGVSSALSPSSSVPSTP